MGGEPLSLISTVMGMATGMMQPKPEKSSDNSAQLEAERKAREEEVRKKEANERKRERDKITEARDLERKRKTAGSEYKTTLATGGAGLIGAPEVKKNGLKNKLGE